MFSNFFIHYCFSLLSRFTLAFSNESFNFICTFQAYHINCKLNAEHRTSNVEHRIRMSLRSTIEYHFLLLLFFHTFPFNVRCWMLDVRCSFYIHYWVEKLNGFRLLPHRKHSPIHKSVIPLKPMGRKIGVDFDLSESGRLK